MANVKIKFSIEVDDVQFADHSVEYESTYLARRPLESKEETLALSVINQMNTLKTESVLKANNWDCLFDGASACDAMVVSSCGDEFKR